MKMKHAIVTGATGFLGRWLVQELLGQGIAVTAVIRDSSCASSVLPADSNLTLVECDMSQYAKLPELLSDVEGSTFFHLAWAGVSGNDRTDLNVQLSNVCASTDAAKAAVELGCAAFVGLGTIMEAESVAVTAEDGLCPGAGFIYGAAKAMAHLQTKIVCGQNQLPHLWAILTNAYGEGETSPRLINSTLRNIFHGAPLRFSAGTQRYDFIYVQDAVRALIDIARAGKPYCSYVIGSGESAPLRTFIERLGRTLAPDQPLLFGDIPYAGPFLPEEAFSIAKLVKDTGFRPQVSFEDGVRRTMDWLKKTEGSN